jgi:hypothetical protein
MVIVEKLVEWRLAGETEVLGGNMPQLHFVHRKSHMIEEIFFFNLCGGILGTAATTGLLHQPRILGDGDCGEISGKKIGRGNQSTRRKPAPPQIPHD